MMMRIKRQKKLTKMIRFFLILLSLHLFACSSPENRIYKNGLKEASLGHFRIAVSEFEKVIKRDPNSSLGIRSAKEAARISLYEIKDYKKAIEFYKNIIIQSKDPSDRFMAQKAIASIYFDNLQNYNAAIAEYTKIIQMNLTPSEEAIYRTNIARAYYYLNDFNQAEFEIKEVMKLDISDDNRFSATLLSGNLLLARKDYTKAIDIFKKLISDFPERSQQENIQLSLAVCYEENNDYASAIKVLETLLDKYSPKEYVELRIRRLKERQKNQPGAKGLKK